MQTKLLTFFCNDPLAHPDNITPDDLVNHWTNTQLERSHNWVQWAFPLPDASRYQPDSPTLGTRDMNQIRVSSVAQANLDALMWRTIDFYDQWHGWLTPYDHNHLRITRIIKSLALLAPPHKALTFYHFIMWKVTSFSKTCVVNPESVETWRRAADTVAYPGSRARTTIHIPEQDALATGSGARVVSDIMDRNAEDLRAAQARAQEGSL